MPRSKKRPQPASLSSHAMAPRFSPSDRLNAGLLLVAEQFGAPGWRGRAAGCAIALTAFSWFWFWSLGDNLAGDPGDSRLAIAILEHWREVFLGRARFLDPPFFHPVKGVLGFSDPYFLHAIPHFLFRLLGADRYVAFHFVQLTLAAVGYWSALLFLEKVFFPRSWASVVGAALFAASAHQAGSLMHSQTRMVFLLPAVLLLTARAIESRGARRGMLTMFAAGALTSLVVFSGFYAAFFFALAVVVWLCVSALLAAIPREEIHKHLRLIGSMWREWLAAAAGLGLALIPAIITYLPALRRSGGGRSKKELMIYLTEPVQWLNPSFDNPWHGAFLAAFGPELTFPYSERHGFPWFTIVLFALSVLALWWWGGKRMLALAISAVILLAIATRYGTMSPWFWVLEHVPGAQGIRVPNRIAMVVFPLMIPVCLTGLIWLNAQLRSSARWILPALVFLWGAEQLRLRPAGLSRKDEAAKFSPAPVPPKACRCFFVTNGTGPHPLYINLDAMMIAAQTGLPTLNGYSGIHPGEWPGFEMGQGYAERMEDWGRQRGAAGICAYDLATHRWSGPRLP